MNRSPLLHGAFAATHWYGSANFWGATSAIIGLMALLVAIAGVVLAYVVGAARRTLVYSMPVNAPLLATPSGLRTDLRVLHNDRALENPHVCEIRVATRGRKDIPSTAFDQDRPLRLDLGVPIVALLQVMFDPAEKPLPKVEAHGNHIEVGPDFIRKHQEIGFTVLADGPDAQLTCESPIIDVTVRPQHQDDTRLSLIRKIIGWAVIILITLWIITYPGGVGKAVNSMLIHPEVEIPLLTVAFAALVGVSIWASRTVWRGSEK